MSIFSTLLRRLRDLVARLFGRAAAPSAPALPDASVRATRPDLVAVDVPPSPPPSSVLHAPADAPASPQPETLAAEVSAVAVAPLLADLVPRVVVDAPPPSDSAARRMADAMPPPESAAASGAAPARDALVAGAPPVLTVRRFFAQVAAAAPGGLTIDFSAWQGAPVDRFFLALMAPERTRRRGPAMGETVSLSGAFDGFEWD